VRIAASIFLAAGLAYLGWGIVLATSNGLRLGIGAMWLVAVALMYQAYTLFLAKPGSRLSGIVASSTLAICFGVIACLLATSAYPRHLLSLPTALWPTLAAVVIVGVAFALAAISLVFSKRAAP